MNDLDRLVREERFYHDRYAPGYRAHISNPRNRWLIRLRSKVFCSRLRPGVRALELGAGVGTWSRHFRDRCPLVSLDISYDSLKLLREAAPEAEPVQADVRSLPFADHSFEQLFVGMVLHHLPFESRDAALEELDRVLKPGGRLIFFEPNRSIRCSLQVAVRKLKKYPLLGKLMKSLQGDYTHHELSPIDEAMGRRDEALEESGIEPQGFIPSEVASYFEGRGFGTRELGYLHSLQLPTPKVLGTRLTPPVVAALHVLERTLFRHAASMSHFFYYVGDKAQS